MNLVKFLLSVLLTSGVNLAAVPAVLHAAGPVNWGGLAVAQAIAALAGVFVAFGWGATGPTAIAQRSLLERGEYLRESLSGRVYLFAVAAPIVVVVTALTAPGDLVANVCAAMAVLTAALAAPWFFIGERAPWRLLLLDTVPRALGTTVGATILLLTGRLIAYPIAQLIGSLIAIAITLGSILRRHPASRPTSTWSLRATLGTLGAQRHGITTAGAAALYVNLPLILVAVVAPSATALYAIADKFQKLTVTAFTPMLQVAQGFVGAVVDEVAQRVRRVTRITVLVGIGIGGAFAGLLPLAAQVFSTGTVAVPFSVSIPLGLATAAICVSAVMGLACLAVLGRMRIVAASTIAGACIGVPLVLLAGHLFGAMGVAWAVALSEIAVVAIQGVALRNALASGPAVQTLV